MANLKSEKDVWMNTLRQTKEYQNTKGLITTPINASIISLILVVLL